MLDIWSMILEVSFIKIFSGLPLFSRVSLSSLILISISFEVPNVILLVGFLFSYVNHYNSDRYSFVSGFVYNLSCSASVLKINLMKSLDVCQIAVKCNNGQKTMWPDVLGSMLGWNREGYLHRDCIYKWLTHQCVYLSRLLLLYDAPWYVCVHILSS